MKLVAVIPAFNEEGNIVSVLEQVEQYVDGIVVVDDGSKDNTKKEVLGASLKKTVLLSNVINSGKGASVRTGADYAVDELGAELLVLIDGDGQHEPVDIPRFVNTLQQSQASIVFGTRKRTKEMPPMMRLGNWGLTLLSSVLLGVHVEDTQCGFRLLTKGAYKHVRWASPDYAMESEMIARTGVHNIKYKEIPIKTVYHDMYKGTTPIDGLRIGIKLIKWRLLLWPSFNS